MTDVLFDNIPDELKALDQWVTWKYNRNGRKLPCSTPSGDVADAHDPASWGTAQAAQAAARKRKHAGIGFDFTTNDPYTGVDLDDCIRDDGTIAPIAAAIIAEANTYTEISPSGKGVKMWLRGRIPESVTSTPIGEGVHTEMYFAGRFFTVTGQRLPGTPAAIRDADDFLAQLYERVKPPAPPRNEQPKALPLISSNADHIRRWCVAALDGEQQKMKAAGDGQRHKRRYASAHALGGLLHTGGLTKQEIFDALAVNFGRDRGGAEATIWDGIAAGEERPRPIPEAEEPTWDHAGHVCCPTHLQRLIPCRNGNGWRCPAHGASLCFWWKGEGYTPPAEPGLEDLDELDPETLRQRLREAIAERDRWKERAVQLEMELGHVQERNRFVTQAAGAEGIHTPSMRLTFIELKKELDRVPLEEREPDQWVRVRPSYMAKCSGQNASNVSRHLTAFKDAGKIEKDVRREYDPEADKWITETYVRPLVDLSDPAQMLIPAKPRGRQACKHCGKENLERQTRTRCTDCGHEEWSDPEPVNPPELQNAILTEDAGDVGMEETIAADVDGLNCKMQIREQDSRSSTVTCAGAIQSAPAADNTDYRKPSRPPSFLDDLDNLPAVRAGLMPPDDPWLLYQREMQRQAENAATP